MPKRLRMKELTSVSLVDKGDNKGAHVLIHKRADAPTAEPAAPEPKDDEKYQKSWLVRTLLKMWGSDEAQTFNEVGRLDRAMEDTWRLTDRMTASLQSILRDEEAEDKGALIAESLEEFRTAVLAAVPVWEQGGSVTKSNEDKESKDMPEQKKKDTNAAPEFDVSTLPEEAQKAYADLQARVKAAEEKAEKAAAEAPKPDGEPAEKAEPKAEGETEKAKPTEELTALEKRAEAAEKKAAEVEKRLEDMEKKERRNGFISKAQALQALPGITADDLAAQLDAYEAANGKEAFEKFFASLKGVAEATESSKLFAEVGKSGSKVGGPAATELAKRVKAMKEADPKLTEAQAMDKVMEADGELAQKVLDEEQAGAPGVVD